MWLTLLLAALWWLLGRLLLFGAPGEAGTATHRVRAEDTIPRLCWQYKVRAEAIRAANPGVDDPLPVGRKLTIPLGHYEPSSKGTAAASKGQGMVKLPARSTPAPSPVPRASPAPLSREKMASRAVTTTRLPPQPPETPAPARRPVTVISAEAPRP